ncbi:MAG: putative 2-hydroxy-3-oxopropionate reductase [Streblomastix strix]|uniref:Putative 2-hydroxy-3-oxopropionate reductase n=1 Tax=Streblomastix strix TaxID=222440 RepID=A0A5J4W6V8_9EUKA|nr:MAG: putative 2-hydroxy-3-oxopropionate reductase [Streblomastix strix]
MSAQPRIGWVGTGLMGYPMCEHLLKAGFHLTVFNRTKSKTDGLIKLGAEWADNPRSVAEKSDIICTMVGFPQDVRDTILNPETGVLAGCQPNKKQIICDFTTSTPSLAEEIETQSLIKGVRSLDCPVSGGDIGAKQAKLTIMAGGDQSAYDEVSKLIFPVVGAVWNHMGNAGTGQHTKGVNQVMIAGTMIGICEGLVYAAKTQKLDLNQVIAAVSGGSAGSAVLRTFGPRQLEHDFSAGFFVKHFYKDLGIVIEESKRMGIQLAGLELVHRLYTKLRAMKITHKGSAEAQIGDELGHHALIAVLEEEAGVDVSVKKK